MFILIHMQNYVYIVVKLSVSTSVYLLIINSLFDYSSNYELTQEELF